MSGIFIKKLRVQNYKCFKDESIEFAVPNGQEGSGLNIFVGENGNGKTTVLEAFDYLTKSAYSAENRLKINDFQQTDKEINITGETEPFRCKSTVDFYIAQGWRFESSGVVFQAESRKAKARGKLLSSPFEIHSHFKDAANYIKKDGTQGKEIDSRDKSFSNSSIEANEINVFYFDKNRSRHLSTGNYRTTFESICDDLNWKFLNSLNPATLSEVIKNISGEYFKSVNDIAQKGTGKKVAKELSKFFDNKTFENIRIDLLELLHPFSTAFFAVRDDFTLNQIKIKDLGSGIEMILTLLLLKNISEQSGGSIIYLIDEPEMHLHPRAQEGLAKILLEESKDKQILVSTHSPYLFKSCVQGASRLFIFRRNKSGKIEISDEKNTSKPLFPWSPSWGEINYKAYDLPTVEFHNELYGYTEEAKKPILEALPKTMVWKNSQSGKDENVSISKYIRNAIHHPENRTNNPYTDKEMRESIDALIGLLK